MKPQLINISTSNYAVHYDGACIGFVTKDLSTRGKNKPWSISNSSGKLLKDRMTSRTEGVTNLFELYKKADFYQNGKQESETTVN